MAKMCKSSGCCESKGFCGHEKLMMGLMGFLVLAGGGFGVLHFALHVV